jgi:hypothetical protein
MLMQDDEIRNSLNLKKAAFYLHEEILDCVKTVDGY